MDGRRSYTFGLVPAALIGLLGILLISSGCKLFSSSSTGHDGWIRQRGEAPVMRTADGRVEVFYPKPFALTPTLKLAKESHSVPSAQIRLLEEYPDHFVVSYSGTGEGILTWEAVGPSHSSTAQPGGG